MNRYEQEYYANVKKQTQLLERIAEALENIKQPINYQPEYEDDKTDDPRGLFEAEAKKLNITGEYLGQSKEYSGPEFEKYLKEILEISLNEGDFVRKTIMGITDETNDIQEVDKGKLKRFYWKEKDEIGYLETTKQEEKDIINKVNPSAAIQYKTKTREYCTILGTANNKSCFYMPVYDSIEVGCFGLADEEECTHCNKRRKITTESKENISKSEYHYRKKYRSLYLKGEYKTKKDAILDYVDSFGNRGARYVDIIRFAFELQAGLDTFHPTNNRGWYSSAFSPRFGGHLVKGGNDYLVQPYNKKYYTNSFLEKSEQTTY